MVHKEPNDLTMSPGDIIDIVEETNADWWTGRNKGRQGLFPSNYIEKLPPDSSPQLYQEKSHIAPGYTNYSNNPPPQQMNPVDNTVPVNSVGLQPDEGQDKKKGKYGKFGNTVCSFPPCFVTILTDTLIDGPFGCWRIRCALSSFHPRIHILTWEGFGAGAAVGSGIINAIF